MNKKTVIGIIISIIIVIVIVGGILLFKINSNNNSDNIIDGSNSNTNQTNESLTEINKYWNIDTSKFDTTLFDGNFSVSGNVINGKITGKTLKDNGYELKIGSGLFKELLWDKDKNVYSDKSNGAYILKNNEEIQGDIFLTNYKNESNIYSDNTEISYYWNDITKTCNNIIIPSLLINNFEEKVYKNLTIDKIVDKLGAPTYVQGRLTKTIKNKQFFQYVYVYEDYTLWFEITYYESTGITITGFRYEGIQAFNQPCKYYDFELDEFRNYNNSLEYLKEEQTKYEKSL